MLHFGFTWSTGFINKALPLPFNCLDNSAEALHTSKVTTENSQKASQPLSPRPFPPACRHLWPLFNTFLPCDNDSLLAALQNPFNFNALIENWAVKDGEGTRESGGWGERRKDKGRRQLLWMLVRLYLCPVHHRVPTEHIVNIVNSYKRKHLIGGFPTVHS